MVHLKVQPAKRGKGKEGTRKDETVIWCMLKVVFCPCTGSLVWIKAPETQGGEVSPGLGPGWGHNREL